MEDVRGLPCLTSPALSNPAKKSEMELPRKRRLLQHIPFAWLMAAKTQGYQLEPKLGSELVSPSASSLLPGWCLFGGIDATSQGKLRLQLHVKHLVCPKTRLRRAPEFQ